MSGDYIALPPDITTLPVPISEGGTGATTAAGARTSLGAAKSGANSDITSLSGLTTPLTVVQGGTGTATDFTAGSIVFAGASGVYTQSNADLFFNNSTKFLGLGTATPSQKFEIIGAASRFYFDDIGSLVGGNSAGGSFNITPGAWTNGNLTFTPTGLAGSLYLNYGGTALNGGIKIFDGFVTELMRVDTTGNVGIGTPSPIYKLMVSASDASGYAGYFLNNGGTATSGSLALLGGTNSASGASMIIFIRPDGTVIGSISQNSATTVAYNTTSDARLKDHIADTDLGIEDLKKISVKKFRYKKDPEKRTFNGFLAQELQSVLPEAVSVIRNTKRPGGTAVEEVESILAIDYSKLSPLIIKSLQQLIARVEALEAT